MDKFIFKITTPNGDIYLKAKDYNNAEKKYNKSDHRYYGHIKSITKYNRILKRNKSLTTKT